MSRCAAIEPRIRDAEVIGHRVGLRPMHSEVRLERTDAHLIHNYGHGGAGVSLSWGCASEIATMIGRVRAYVTESARIAAIDSVINELDRALTAAGLSKAALGRATGTEPAVIRRLFSASGANPR